MEGSRADKLLELQRALHEGIESGVHVGPSAEGNT